MFTFPIGFFNLVASGGGSVTTDPYANNVVLFLRGDGVNNSANIIDSSSNPKVITVHGNTKISTAQFKYGGSSIDFINNNPALRIAYNNELSILSSDMTIELWCYPFSFFSQKFLIAQWQQVFQGGGFLILFDSNAIRVGIGSISESVYVIDGTETVTLNAWNHIALSREGSTYRLFKNGNLIGSVNSSATKNLAIDLTIGNYLNSSGSVGAAGAEVYDGYLDAIRITTVARYITNFNSETDTYLQSFGSDNYFSSTPLLLQGDNINTPATIINSGNTISYSVNITNNSVVNSQNSPKFGIGSLYFDPNTPSYINCSSNAFNVGGHDCTIECFVKLLGNINTSKVIWEMRPDLTNGSFPLLQISENNINLYFSGNTVINVNPTITSDNYYYIAVRKIGNLTELWLEGNKLADFTSGDWGNSGRILIGRLAFDSAAPSTRLNGYIDSFRFTLGVARDVSTIPVSAFPTN